MAGAERSALILLWGAGAWRSTRQRGMGRLPRTRATPKPWRRCRPAPTTVSGGAVLGAGPASNQLQCAVKAPVLCTAACAAALLLEVPGRAGEACAHRSARRASRSPAPCPAPLRADKFGQLRARLFENSDFWPQGPYGFEEEEFGAEADEYVYYDNSNWQPPQQQQQVQPRR